MNKKLLQLTTFIIILGIVFSSTAGISTQTNTTAQRPVILQGPRGDIPLFEWLKGAMIPVIFGMQDANFSTGDVLYSEFNTVDQFIRILPRSFSNTSVNLSLDNFKASLDYVIANDTRLPLLVKNLLQELQSEIGSNSELTVNRYSLITPTKKVEQLSHFVLFLYDPDKSVINAMDKIRANETLLTQPFTGDEIITSVRMDKIIESIYGRYNEQNVFKYNNGTLAKKFVQFGLFLNQHPIIAHEIIKTLNLTDEIRAIRNLVSELDSVDREISVLHPLKNVNVGFTVSQLQINNLTFAKRFNNLILNNFDVTLVEHNALGITIYNDTNANGIMDLAMRTLASDRPGLNGTVIPSGSDEALYRVDFKGAQSSKYVPVSKTSDKNELTFSFSAQNLNVQLNPVSRNLDEALFSNISDLHQTISEFGYTFHFLPNETSNKIDIKYDYNLGDWSNKTMLEGLSLNQMILTGISDLSGKQRVMKIDSNTRDDINASDKATSAKKFQVKAGQSPIAEIDLDQIPYTVGGTTEEFALGQTLPLLFADFLFGKISAHGDVIKTIGGKASSTKYLYSISYPVFGGESISHDPTFSMVAGSSTSTETNGSNKTGVFGFEIISILALPMIIALKKKKHD